MMKVATHAMSAKQGRDYHTKEYSLGDYHMKDAREVPGEWSGKGAERLELR